MHSVQEETGKSMENQTAAKSQKNSTYIPSFPVCRPDRYLGAHLCFLFEYFDTVLHIF
jgi:hypothetical protein